MAIELGHMSLALSVVVTLFVVHDTFSRRPPPCPPPTLDMSQSDWVRQQQQGHADGQQLVNKGGLPQLSQPIQPVGQAAGDLSGNSVVVSGNEPWFKDPWRSPLILPEQKLVICSVPKCGSTTLRRLVGRMLQSPHWQSNGDAIHYWLASRHDAHLGDLSPQEASRVMGDPAWRKIAVVRHPVTRTLSAYKDKVLRAGWGKSYSSDPQRKPTFEEFVVGLLGERGCMDNVDAQTKTLNEHWQHLQCFCGLDKLQSVYEVFHLDDAPSMVKSLVDSGHLLKPMVDSGWGKKGNESLFRYLSANKLETSHHTRQQVNKYYTKVVLNAIKMKYQEDMARFGFNPEEFDDDVEAAGDHAGDNGIIAEFKLSAGQPAAEHKLVVSGLESWFSDVWRTPLLLRSQKLVVCSIPMNAAKTLRRLAGRLVGSPVWIDPVSPYIHYWLASKAELHLNDLSPSEATAVMHDPEWRKLAVVHHPVPRLLAAYKARMSDPEVARDYSGSEEMPSFAVFVRAVVKEAGCSDPPGSGTRSMREQWGYQHCFCGLRQLAPLYEAVHVDDLATLVESLVNDRRLPEQMATSGWGNSSKEPLFDFLDNAAIAKRRDEIQRDIALHYTKELLALVKDKYAIDIGLFGFDPDKYDGFVSS